MSTFNIFFTFLLPLTNPSKGHTHKPNKGLPQLKKKSLPSPKFSSKNLLFFYELRLKVKDAEKCELWKSCVAGTDIDTTLYPCA
jgi:hypothetical protein